MRILVPTQLILHAKTQTLILLALIALHRVELCSPPCPSSTSTPKIPIDTTHRQLVHPCTLAPHLGSALPAKACGTLASVPAATRPGSAIDALKHNKHLTSNINTAIEQSRRAAENPILTTILYRISQMPASRVFLLHSSLCSTRDLQD